MTSQMRNKELTQLARNFRAAQSDTDSAIYKFLSSLDCPRAMTVWLLYESGEHDQLASLAIDPLWFNNPYTFRDAYAATEFLSKSDFLKLDISKKDQAFKKFDQFELQCKHTNSRFKNLLLDPSYKGLNVTLLHAMTRKIEQILGDFSPDEFVDQANWGPGVTTLLKGEHVSAVNKFHSENGITHDLYPLVAPWFAAAYPLWDNLICSRSTSRFTLQVGNSVVTVPKNSKTDRVIAIEPGINLWFQKSLGTMIRRRLRRFGIDLNSQLRNQQLARSGSIDSELATVDFSSASDSISKELVREVIPPKWFQLLNATRSPVGIHNKRPIHWEKFSSMGNGFTFELESLIFYAAALAVREELASDGEISVFGDDVILPTTCYELFSSFSEFLGFTVNMKKSFSSTYFRESCGSHYWAGVDCKPIYLKERLRYASSVFKLANSIRFLSHRRNNYYGCDSKFQHCWHHLRSRLPKPLRFGCPLGSGDGGFIMNFDEATPIRARYGLEGYHCAALLDTGVTQYFEEAALLLARLWVRSDKDHRNTYDLRGRTRIRVSRVLVSQWYNLGEWI